MRSILHDSNLTAQWLELVKEAQAKILIRLEEDLENYLVFLLIRFMTHPEMADRSIALDFLSCYAKLSQHSSRELQGQLQDVGDRCLILSGLFPAHAQRRGSKISYFVNLGRTAYDSLSMADPLYHHLALKFTTLKNILFMLRGNAQQNLGGLQRDDYVYPILHTLKKKPH